MRSTEDNEKIEAVIMVTPVERQGGMRLNNVMKAQVIEKALKHAFEKRQALLLKEEQALTRAFWLHTFGPAKLKAATLLGFPFVHICTDRYDTKVPDGVPMVYNVSGHSLTMRCQLPVPTSFNFDKYGRMTIKDEALVARCRVWQDNADKCAKEREQISATLSGMLQNISTYTSLEKNWPQGKKFYQHLPTAFPFRHQVPAVLVDQLNAALGIS